MTPKRIIIDTDPGIDDSLAILLALASPEVQLEGLTKQIIKKLTITTDDAYKFCTIFSQDDGTEHRVILESSSKSKGRTEVDICAGDMYGEVVSVSLGFLNNVLLLGDTMGVDLDNNVGIVTKGENEEHKYVFSLG